MRVVDTSAWIEWLKDTKLANAIEAVLPPRPDWVVPTIVQLELAKWAYRTLDEKKADKVIAFSEKCMIVPLESSLGLAAAALCREHKLATADAIVYATARAHGADLLTCDMHFKNLPNVILIEKRA